MPCLNDYDYEVLLQHITYAQAEEFIRDKYWEVYYFEPGFRVLGLRLLGDTAVPVAIESGPEDMLVFPYTKPCMGTFVLRFGDVADEVQRIRSSYSKSLTLQRYADTSGKRREAVAITCPMDVSLRNFSYDILSHFRTFRECESYIREKYPQTLYCEPGFKVLGLKPLGKDYITVAIEDNNENVIFPFYDSGMGALIIRIKGVPDEVVRIRENYSRALTEQKLKLPVGADDRPADAGGKRKGHGTLSRILGRSG